MSRWVHTVTAPDSVSMTMPEGSLTQIVVSSESETPQVDSPEETLQMVAWAIVGIPRNPDAALYKYARAHALGAPLTSEFDFQHDGVLYRGQGYALGIVYCEVGQWDQVRATVW